MITTPGISVRRSSGGDDSTSTEPGNNAPKCEVGSSRMKATDLQRSVKDSPVAEESESKTDEQEARNEEQIDAIWTCGTCKNMYSSQASILDHMQVLHSSEGEQNFALDTAALLVSDSRFKCDVCGEIFTSANMLREHSLRHVSVLKQTSFPCTNCDRVFLSTKEASLHRIEMHPCPELRCDICMKGFPTVHLLNVHARKTHSGNAKRQRQGRNLTTGVTLKCPRCSVTFYDSSVFKAHRTNCHVICNVSWGSANGCVRVFSRMIRVGF